MPSPRLRQLFAIVVLSIASLAIAVSALARAHSGASDRVTNHATRASHGGHRRPGRHRARVKPAVSWTTPKASGRVSGQLDERAQNCVVSARARSGIHYVRFFRDGAVLNTQRDAPYSCVWNTTHAAEGSSHTLKAVARDMHGRRAWTAVKVTVHNAPRADTNPPGTTITAGPSGTIPASDASFSFGSSETGSSFQCSLDGGSWASCSSPKAYGGLADGAHEFQVRATDAAGNTDDTPAGRRFTVDTSPPTVSWTQPTAGASVSGQLNEDRHNCVVSTSSSSAIDHVDFYLDGALLNTQRDAPYSCLWDTTTAAEGSSHTLEAVAYDTSGKSASASVGVTVTNAPPPDTTAPQTAITAGPSGTITTSSASFSFGSSETGSSFQCSLDGGPWASCASPKAYNSLSDGSHTFGVRATDSANNTDSTPATRSFTVDRGGGSGGSGYPSLPEVDWDGGFDPGCQLVGSGPGAWDANETNGGETNTLGSTTLERNMVGEGECGAKFTNAASGDQTRSELQRSSTGADPEFTYEMLVRVPSAQTFPKGASISQTKQEKSGGRGCYNGGWGITDGTGATGGGLQYRTVFACTSPQGNGQQTFAAGILPRDQWFALRVHEKFSSDPQVGFLQAWVDADGLGPGTYVEVIPKTHVDNVTGRTVRLRIGQYRQGTDHTTTVYIDGMHLDCDANC
jgi:hypothetical protein